MKYGPIDHLVEELDKKPNQVLFVLDHTPARHSASLTSLISPGKVSPFVHQATLHKGPRH